jgi:hypothetical protein
MSVQRLARPQALHGLLNAALACLGPFRPVDPLDVLAAVAEGEPLEGGGTEPKESSPNCPENE